MGYLARTPERARGSGRDGADAEGFPEVGGSVFGGAAVPGLAGCASPEPGQGEGKGLVELRRSDLEYAIQCQHPEKMPARLPTQPEITDALISPFFGVDADAYEEIRSGFAIRARGAALELLENFDFRERVDLFPFEAGTTVVGLEESITDDLLSWFEVPALPPRRAPSAGERQVHQCRYLGDTTADTIGRFLPDVVQQGPDWVVSMMGRTT